MNYIKLFLSIHYYFLHFVCFIRYLYSSPYLLKKDTYYFTKEKHSFLRDSPYLYRLKDKYSLFK